MLWPAQHDGSKTVVAEFEHALAAILGKRNFLNGFIDQVLSHQRQAPGFLSQHARITG